jgi:hypothetical protein
MVAGGLKKIQDVLGRINRLLSFDTTRTKEKRCLQQFCFVTGKCLPSHWFAMIKGHTDRPTNSPLIQHGPSSRRRVQQFFHCCMYSLPRERVYRSVALQRQTRKRIQAHRLMGGIHKVRLWDGLRYHDIKYIPSFIKIGWGIQKLIWGNTQIHRQHGGLISLLIFFSK